jgi:hypothetical protein
LKRALFPFILLIAPCAKATVLSDNLQSPTYYTELVGGQTEITAAFRTDDSAYVLNSVTALMQQDSPGALTLSLYASQAVPPNDLGFQPGKLLGTLFSPSTYPTALATASFGGADLMLSPDTTYWIVMSVPTSGKYEWAYAASNEGTGVGFYPSWGASSNGGQSWYTDDLQPMQMSVSADVATPEPNLSSLLLFGLVLLLPASKARMFPSRIS